MSWHAFSPWHTISYGAVRGIDRTLALHESLPRHEMSKPPSKFPSMSVHAASFTHATCAYEAMRRKEDSQLSLDAQFRVTELLGVDWVKVVSAQEDSPRHSIATLAGY